MSPATVQPLQPPAGRYGESSTRGRWRLTGVSPSPRAAAPTLDGFLDLGGTPVTPDLELQAALTPIGGRRPVDVTVQARLTGIDRTGDWRFSGTAMVADSPTEVTVRIHDVGIYKQGERHTRWLRVRLEALPTRRRRVPWLMRAQRRDRFVVDVNGERAVHDEPGVHGAA